MWQHSLRKSLVTQEEEEEEECVLYVGRCGKGKYWYQNCVMEAE
jgi:hypothetical protein